MYFDKPTFRFLIAATVWCLILQPVTAGHCDLAIASLTTTYIGNHPDEKSVGWQEGFQGFTHGENGDDHWYLTQQAIGIFGSTGAADGDLPQDNPVTVLGNGDLPASLLTLRSAGREIVGGVSSTTVILAVHCTSRLTGPPRSR